MLEQCAFRVTAVATAREAIEHVRLNEAPPDLALLDLTIGDLPAPQAVAELRRLRPALRVLVTSGYTLTDASQDVAATGAEGFIQKPFRTDRLAEKINAVLHLRQV
jgi:DNA-binding NarL/FixJ family response regulator